MNKYGEMEQQATTSLQYDMNIKDKLDAHIQELREKLRKAKELKVLFDENADIAKALDLLKEVNVF